MKFKVIIQFHKDIVEYQAIQKTKSIASILESSDINLFQEGDSICVTFTYENAREIHNINDFLEAFNFTEISNHTKIVKIYYV